MTAPAPPRNSSRIAGVLVIDRAEFLADYWQYRAGQHVTVIGKTGSGKTTLTYELLDRSATPQLPALTLVMKPRDATATRYARDLNMPRTYGWPPPPHKRRLFRRPDTRGWTVWPKLTMDDPQEDDERLYDVFLAALRDSYKKGKRIVFCDEVVDLCELSSGTGANRRVLRPRVEQLWRQGRSMECGLWAATQRPVGMSGHAYSAPEHMFLSHDPDQRTRKRYDEIGGADSGLVAACVRKLPPFHFFYLQRSTGTFCVVGP